MCPTSGWDLFWPSPVLCSYEPHPKIKPQSMVRWGKVSQVIEEGGEEEEEVGRKEGMKTRKGSQKDPANLIP